LRGAADVHAIGAAIDHHVGHAVVDQPALQLPVQRCPGIGEVAAVMLRVIVRQGRLVRSRQRRPGQERHVYRR
jgi:hypothetical protein